MSITQQISYVEKLEADLAQAKVELKNLNHFQQLHNKAEEFRRALQYATGSNSTNLQELSEIVKQRLSISEP